MALAGRWIFAGVRGSVKEACLVMVKVAAGASARFRFSRGRRS